MAKWVTEEAKKREAFFEVDLLDLLDWPLPFYNELVGPSALKGNYQNAIGKRWAGKIGEADGYLVVAPEYNHGYSAVLKNALDFAYDEWSKKPMAFVSYSASSTAGARGVEQLRLVAIELGLAPLQAALHIPGLPRDMATWDGSTDEKLQKKLDTVLTELAWWAGALKTARKVASGPNL